MPTTSLFLCLFSSNFSSEIFGPKLALIRDIFEKSITWIRYILRNFGMCLEWGQYYSANISSNFLPSWKMLKNISPPLGVGQFNQSISTNIPPTLWVAYLHKYQTFRRKPFSPWLISLAEKWIECRFPLRWDWPWNAFNRSSHKSGWSIERYSRQQGILSMCWSPCEKPP